MTSTAHRPVPTRTGLDLRLLIPSLAAWCVAVTLLWSGARTVIVAGVAGVSLLSSAWFVARSRVRARSCHRGHSRAVSMGLTTGAVALVTMCLSGHELIRAAGYLDELVDARATVTIVAFVESDPRRVSPRPGRRVEERLVTARLRVIEVMGRGMVSEVSAPLLVVGDDRWLAVAYGEQIRAVGRLVAAEAGDDVVAILQGAKAPEVMAEAPAVLRGAAYVRTRFREATALLPADPAGLVPALVIGDTSATPDDLTAAMKATGMSHLSAVSGSNVSLILAATLGLCRVVGIRRRWRPVLAVILLGGFVVLTRPEPSVVRAAVMGVVGLVGMTMNRQRMAVPALSTAIIALLCWDPWLARSYGFALSVLATLGLVLFASSWGEWIARRLPTWLAGMGPALAVPLAAQVMVAPVVVLLQESVQFVSLPANLLAGPLVGPATIGGVATALVSVVWMPAAQLAAWVPGVPAWGIAVVARVAASMPGGSAPWPGGPWGAAALGVVCVMGVAAGPWVGYQVRERPAAAVAAFGVLVAGLAPVSSGWATGAWRFVACAVGQGDALVAASGPGRAVLIDVGPDPELVNECLDRLGIHTLDAIVLTHFHADHVAGLVGALRGRSVAEIITCPIRDPPYEVDTVFAAAARAGVPVSEAYAGDRYEWGLVQARVWWPARVIRDGSVPNNASVVMTMSVGGGGSAANAPELADVSVNVALLGDIEQPSARAILSAWRRDPAAGAWRVDVLKVAHHGSANRDDALLDAMPAPLAVICVGAGNDYGHPAQPTLAALVERGFRVMRTDRDGDIAISREAGGPLLVSARGP